MFLLPCFFKYCSNLRTVNEKKFCFDARKSKVLPISGLLIMIHYLHQHDHVGC